MEKQYSVQFFTSFVEHLQDVCRNYLNYNQFVEVSGYVCVEIDNMKKERYVLSELLQSSGNVVSESYCTKAFKTSSNSRTATDSWNLDRNYSFGDRNKENRSQREPCQSREITLASSGHFSHASSKAEFTVSESQMSRTQEKHVSLPQQSVHVPQDESPPTSDYADTFTSTSSTSFFLHQDDEVIDLDTTDDDLDLPESMETAGCDNFSDTTISPQVPDFNRERKSELSPGTLATVRQSVKKFCKFHFERCGEDIDLPSTPPEKLNQLLLDYYQGAQKITGGALTANTLKSVQKHLDMFLKGKGYPYSIGKSRQFNSSREYLKKKLSEVGKSVSQIHTPVTNEDMELLFQTNQLGVHSSDSLLNTMWFVNSKYFGIRRPAEHFNMKWGDLRLGVNDQGHEYLERPIHGTFSLKVFAKPDMPNRCFVNFYKQYCAMRPKIRLDKESPFYLKPQRNSDVWFLPEKVMYSFLTYIWRKILMSARLPSDKRIF